MTHKFSSSAAEKGGAMGWLPSPTGGPTAATAATAADDDDDDEVTLSAEPKLVPTAGDGAA